MKQRQLPRLKTRAEVRAAFKRAGVSIVDWARQHKVNPNLVHNVLADTPRRACSRGQSHRIAVLLGLKHGEIVNSAQAVNA